MVLARTSVVTQRMVDEKKREECRHVKRRAFLELVGAGALQHGFGGQGRAQPSGGPSEPAAPTAEGRLAGMSLAELQESFHDQLFKELLPFWAKHGIDDEYGGIMCSLDYDGTRALHRIVASESVGGRRPHKAGIPSTARCYLPTVNGR